MLSSHALGDRPDEATAVEAAVDAVLQRGLRTPDLAAAGEEPVGTEEITDVVLARL